MKKLLPIIIILVIAAVGFLVFRDQAMQIVFAPTESSIEQVPASEDKRPVVFAEELDIPWDIVYLDEEILVTERPGTVAVLNTQGEIIKRIEIAGISTRAEGGLLGMMIDPEFNENRYIYLYETYEDNGTRNRVVRYVYTDGDLREKNVLIDGIPGATYHDGGRIAFGPDGMIYITTGDAVRPAITQDIDSLGGKILRMNKDGSVPADNPFGNYVYSYGHRNPQGLAWDENGRLWSTEHGPSGLESGNDELNLIVAGGNYGWPYYAGETIREDSPEERSGYLFPVAHSGDDEVWAPAGLTIIGDTMYWGGLRGASLYRATIEADGINNLVRLYFEEYGRIRTTFVDPGGNLGFTTSNTDGRGNPQTNDDRIIIIE